MPKEKFPPPIPKGTYDYGSGYFDPATEQIVSYDGKEVLGYVTEGEEKWIKDHCRKGFEDGSLPVEKNPDDPDLVPVSKSPEGGADSA
mmetsp:Transcript_59488/g.192401  ORF Transcript_59488/g.192401 Transcript_59488/m.192401 type:complete len:88 (+) Transcript_59488:2-265(+)